MRPSKWVNPSDKPTHGGFFIESENTGSDYEPISLDTAVIEVY